MRQLIHRRDLEKRRLLTRLTGDAAQFHAERLEKLGDGLTDITATDHQHAASAQAAWQAVIPTLLDLRRQAGEQAPFMGQQMTEHVFGHHLTEDADSTCQTVIAR